MPRSTYGIETVKLTKDNIRQQTKTVCDYFHTDFLKEVIKNGSKSHYTIDVIDGSLKDSKKKVTLFAKAKCPEDVITIIYNPFDYVSQETSTFYENAYFCETYIQLIEIICAFLDIRKNKDFYASVQHKQKSFKRDIQNLPNNESLEELYQAEIKQIQTQI